MTLSEMQTMLQYRLGQKSGLEDRIFAELNSAIVRLDRSPELPYFLIADYSETISTQKISLPPAYLRDDDSDGWSVYIVNSSGPDTPLEKDDYDQLESNEDLSGTGKPQFYALRGSHRYLYPAPDTSYTLRTFYYIESLLTNTPTSACNWSLYGAELLMAEAGRSIARTLRDKEAVQFFTEEVMRLTRDMVAVNVSRDEAGRKPVMGG